MQRLDIEETIICPRASDILKKDDDIVWTLWKHKEVNHKQVYGNNFATFAGIAAQRYMAPADQPTTIVGAADVYMSDFGTISVVPNRFMVASNSADDVALVLDPEFAEVAYLRPFETNDLAIAGDQANKQQLIAEYTLGVLNEGAHGIIADLS